MYIFIPIGIVLGLIVMISYLVWRFRGDARDKQKKLNALADGVAAIDIKRMTELAATFGHYVNEAFGVDLAQMEFAEHVQYIGKHLRKLSKRDYSSYFPGGENEFITAVIADLGDLISARYHAKWIRGEEPPYLPFVLIEFPNGNKTVCNPVGAVLMQLVNGDDCGAVVGMIKPFENPGQIQKEVAEITDSYHEEEMKTELELNHKLLKNLIFTRRVACGLILGCYLIPLLFILHQIDRQAIVLTVIGPIASMFFIIPLFKERWQLWKLVRYHRLVLYPDCFCLETNHDKLQIAYADVITCKIGNKPSGLTEGPANADFLQIKTQNAQIRLLENYFLNHNAAKKVFAEIVQRVAAAKGEHHE